jgi:hypothetical protein
MNTRVSAGASDACHLDVRCQAAEDGLACVRSNAAPSAIRGSRIRSLGALTVALGFSIRQQYERARTQESTAAPWALAGEMSDQARQRPCESDCLVRVT